MALDFGNRLRDLELGLQRRRGQRDELVRRLALEEAEVLVAEGKERLARGASELVGAAIEARKEELRARVEVLVTRGLRAVFGRPDYDFSFVTRVRGSRIGIEPRLRSAFGDRIVDVSIVEGHGGGIADVISFLLRVVVVSLARPKLAPFVVLDEPFRHVWVGHIRGAAQLVRELNRSAGIQFLIVTHQADLVDAADVVWRASLVDGRTIFELEHDLKDESFHARPPAGAVAEAKLPQELLPLDDLIGTEKKRPKLRPSGGAILVESKVDDPLARKQQAQALTKEGRREQIWDARRRNKLNAERSGASDPAEGEDES